jgi:hypothetical protein
MQIKDVAMKKCCLAFLIAFTIIICLAFASCKKQGVKIKYEYGIFPDTVISLAGINTEYNDYNIAPDPDNLYNLTASFPLVFSSDRNSSGVSFDLVYGYISYEFNRVTGSFSLSSEIVENPFFKNLVSKMNTTGNDFGPNRIYCSGDGFEYAFVASEISGRGLDIMYSKYLPFYSATTVIPSPAPVSLVNGSSNDAYISFNSRFDTLYFCSDRGGNFDIYYLRRANSLPFNDWLFSPQASPSEVDSIRTSANEKCPFIAGRVMVFASDREGGYGGWDLYYSVFRGGKWSSPKNMGDKVNSAYNEYRPVVVANNSFTNKLLLFSSDRPGGKGGYDLYFSSFNIK